MAEPWPRNWHQCQCGRRRDRHLRTRLKLGLATIPAHRLQRHICGGKVIDVNDILEVLSVMRRVVGSPKYLYLNSLPSSTLPDSAQPNNAFRLPCAPFLNTRGSPRSGEAAGLHQRPSL
ncbi:hypothetical protein BC936DRAFT_141068, partial [Jimgerdemannia flammicorona]